MKYPVKKMGNLRKRMAKFRSFIREADPTMDELIYVINNTPINNISVEPAYRCTVDQSGAYPIDIHVATHDYGIIVGSRVDRQVERVKTQHHVLTLDNFIQHVVPYIKQDDYYDIERLLK